MYYTIIQHNITNTFYFNSNKMPKTVFGTLIFTLIDGNGLQTMFIGSSYRDCLTVIIPITTVGSFENMHEKTVN